MSETSAARDTPDMSPEEFRRHGHVVVDWIAEYLANVGSYPVLAQVQPGDISASLPVSPPQRGEEMGEILADFERTIMPGITHWNSPGFFGYFSITGAAPGILGEMLSAGLNVNGMLWRTSPSLTELEDRSLDWLRQMMGLPDVFRGTIQDTASISTLVAVAAAREAAGLGIRDEGMSGRGLPRLRLYCSEETHSSVERAGIVLGIGRAGTRHIPTDAQFRMDPAALEAAIEEDVAAGWKPFCVVATVGTTSTTSIDPVPAIADVCERHGLWLHVDAAYGGSAAVVPEMRHVLAGVERADSLVVNPHKWLFVPIDISALYARDPEAIRRAFTLVPAYLHTPEGATAVNLMDFGPALGKRFRALKLWMTLRWFGAEGIASRIREHLRLAQLFAGWVDADPEWERMAPVPFSLVLYRHVPPGLTDEEVDAHNERIMDAVNGGGEAFLSHTRVQGRFALRLAIGNLRTTEETIARTWHLLHEAAARV
ncbi:MAG TPA: pyridoxal-dependent decarboxylase [Longimicrobiaceae bacterium]|nr:pyridoxal-dependent decarboxylase [Longimicrobiaceae bacterium]